VRPAAALSARRSSVAARGSHERARPPPTLPGRDADARWGRTAHIVFFFFCFLTNIIVTSMLILGGASVMNALTGMDIYAVRALDPRATWHTHAGVLQPDGARSRLRATPRRRARLRRPAPRRAGGLPDPGRHHPVHGGGRPQGDLHRVVRAHGHHLRRAVHLLLLRLRHVPAAGLTGRGAAPRRTRARVRSSWASRAQGRRAARRGVGPCAVGGRAAPRPGAWARRCGTTCTRCRASTPWRATATAPTSPSSPSAASSSASSTSSATLVRARAPRMCERVPPLASRRGSLARGAIEWLFMRAHARPRASAACRGRHRLQ
jgi:hypothetical protein